jgi:alpha-beta hydrolase superfamily lysophospholipase
MPRLWLCLPPLLLYACDVLLTLAGQPAGYWQGDFASAQEFNPLANALLRLHPLLFVSAALAWAVAFTAIILTWRSRLAVVMAFLITFLHAVGAATWLMRGGVPGYVAAVGLLFAAERLWHACSSRSAGRSRPHPYANGMDTDGHSVEAFTAGDGYRWLYRRYLASPPERARIVCIHGIQSHGGWYEHSCRYLAEAGFGVVFIDRRGAGLNEQARGDAPSFRRLLDDLAEFLRAERPTAGGPLFLLAISWGGKLAVALQRRHPGVVDGLVLLCPGLCQLIRPSPRLRMAILGSRLFVPERLLPIPLDDPALFTASPQWQKFIQTDPLSLRKATARFLLESARLDGYLSVTGDVRVPLLLMLAGQDRIVDNPGTRAFVEKFATTSKTVIEYPEAHHTLEFEPDPERYLADVVRWLSRRSGF